MSTGAGCLFTEVEPGKWTYWLQSWPYGDGSEGQTFGPFDSFAVAVASLQENHANPGGWAVVTHPTAHVHAPVRGAWVKDEDGRRTQWDNNQLSCDACGAEL